MTDRPASTVPDPATDPARAWAYEHYGFDDPVPDARPAQQPGTARRGFRVGVVSAVLTTLLVGGAGGAALAAADATPWGGPNGGAGDGGGPGGGGRR